MTTSRSGNAEMGTSYLCIGYNLHFSADLLTARRLRFQASPRHRRLGCSSGLPVIQDNGQKRVGKPISNLLGAPACASPALVVALFGH